MIEIKNLCKTYSLTDGSVEALKDVSLSIPDGDVFGIIGMSGAGKSTLVRCINMLERPTAGSVVIDGKDLTKMTEKELRAERQSITMIFQGFNLLMQKNCLRNVCFPLELAGVKKAEATKKAQSLLELVGLGDKASAYPAQLSGGQQQRVALARALVVEPGVLLFDEPLSNLDAKLRVSMRTEIRRIQQEVGITAIYVTHDQSEAMALSDQIIIMNKGVVAQIGTPQEIYFHPVSEFVADFIGEANFLRGKVLALEGNTATLAIEGETAHVEATRPVSVGEEVTMVLRPESATLTEDRGLPCKVEVSCFMGSYQNYHVRVGETLVKLTEYNPKNKRIFAQGENCFVHFDANATHIL